ncbi:sulfotransferase [Spirillospora sp. NPDC047279]|uniref:sulfotransferase n=1 Tax=Spirillospora sp. NPDC047279 TaxID=3155478 RepID=UPI0034066E5E
MTTLNAGTDNTGTDNAGTENAGTRNVRVLYITGMTRCGSTMLGNVLNELPGVVHIGELHYLWRNGILRSGTNSQCGCGDRLADCELWSEVMASAATPTDPAHARWMVAVQDRYLRTRHTPARLAEARGPLRRAHALDAALDVTARIYRALAARPGTRLIVDSSKYPAEAAALLGLRDPDLDLRVLHMVRDPRATAFSYQRQKNYIAEMSPLRSTAGWSGVNLASELVGKAAPGRYLRVRHEDFGRDPRGVLGEVMRFAGVDGPGPVGDGGRVSLGENHTVTGNPDRLDRGEVAIRCDERWRTGLDRAPRAVATVGAWPQIRRYGYEPAAGEAKTAEPAAG